ncbi:hypothetical protein HJC23_005541 [Cyclotella cryptica]|uniref:Uncharacterized protein n=1 Tax=Cyclotella cryptica TaxID=29204 RepID=A0ABD3PZ00_9STRA
MFDSVGVTSILPVPNAFESNESDSNKASGDTSIEFYVGTKRGKIKHVVIPQIYFERMSLGELLNDTDSIQVHDVSESAISKKSTIGEVTLKPYPVYSMTVVSKPATTQSKSSTTDEYSSAVSVDHVIQYDVLTGGGDRYITIWEAITNSGGNQRQLKLKQQLGPHTGWVKDIASFNGAKIGTNDDCSLVFSIGCNCIEVWLSSHPNYQHMCKLQIESCPELGATLSSDLLCLATYSCSVKANSMEESNQQPDLHLIAGGVDGRLHRWVLPKSSRGFGKGVDGFFNSGVIAAHRGRVNDVLVCNQIGALLSVGSDGCVTCRMISRSKPFDEWETSCINMTDAFLPFGSSIKLTSSCIVVEGCTEVIVAVGSSCGNLFLFQISKIRRDNVELSLLMRLEICNLRDDKDHCIHSLSCFDCRCRLRDPGSYVVAVGHSNGLSLCLLSLGMKAMNTT